MATALRPIAHEDRLSLVEHLDELRTRIIICLAGFLVAFGLCFWQNDKILEILDRPLEKSAFTRGSEDPLERTAWGVGEPFPVTCRVVGYAALLLPLPLLLYQAYAFVLPAFSPRERDVAVPLLLGVPFLFAAGVVFAYFLVLPPAINFLQNFNDDSYDILLQARDFYSFELLVLIAMGALFQIPVGILAATRLGVVTPRQLRKGRRYAFVIIAVIAALLPGQDPVTMLILMAPLVVLYEGSILFASLLDRRAARARDREEAEEAAADDDELHQ